MKIPRKTAAAARDESSPSFSRRVINFRARDLRRWITNLDHRVVFGSINSQLQKSRQAPRKRNASDHRQTRTVSRTGFILERARPSS